MVSHTLKGMLSSLAVTRAAASVGHLEQIARGGAEASLKEAFAAFASEVQGLLARDGRIHGRGEALIADDEALSRRLLEKTLERAGYEVTAVENGSLAAQQLSQPDGPRLALLDSVKPRLDAKFASSTSRATSI